MSHALSSSLSPSLQVSPTAIECGFEDASCFVNSGGTLHAVCGHRRRRSAAGDRPFRHRRA